MNACIGSYRLKNGTLFRLSTSGLLTTLHLFAQKDGTGPASVPIVLSKLREMGRLKKGNRIALLGIGSGLNCTMAEVEW